jgi:hypothetical protein
MKDLLAQRAFRAGFGPAIASLTPGGGLFCPRVKTLGYCQSSKITRSMCE